MFHKMPLVLIGLIAIVIGLGQFIPLEVKQFLFACSLSIKSIILFLLPLVIFGLLFKTAVNLSRQATGVILIILAAVCCSNFAAAFLSHYVGSIVYHFDLSIAAPIEADALQPAWQWGLPQLIANDKAMFTAILFGIVFALLTPKRANSLADKLQRLVNHILKLFMYLIPVFVAGYLIKLESDGMINTILHDYAGIFLVVAAAQFTYIGFLYLLLSKGRLLVFFKSIKNMLPAAISGFTTMSSAASLPLSIAGVEANAKNKELARSIVPATVNIHLLGDCFAIPIFAYAVLKSFGMPEPSLMTYLIFTMYFVIAKFSVAAVPGGGIIVMLPILGTYLGFNAPMMSLITALYILLDPVITCANVLGNGAFARIIEVQLERGRYRAQTDSATGEFTKA